MLQQIQKPIIQAPMAGVTTPQLVIASCEAGILGSIGAGYLNGEETRAFIQAVKQGTDKPFSVNLFVQEEPKIDVFVLQEARVALQPIYDELNIPPVQTVISNDVYSAQLQVVIDENVPICSFTFGLPAATDIQRLKAAGIYMIGTATTLEEAKAVEAAGLDAVVLQGSEAGGHRGTFTEPLTFISLQDLLAQVIGQVQIPVIAAGGIATAHHVKEVLAQGAVAAQIGTAFLVAEESGASATYKQAILQSENDETTLTKAFTGKYARGLKNDFTERLKDAVVAPYPLQHHLTTAIRKESTAQGRPEFLSLWMGANGHLAKEAPVAEIVEALLAEVR
ncbi:nitronate monooxygenase [Metasolibacillus sp.]|uniref:NAD(P)H-dependent flavin oxidoreductase n=1 Tax=Metasolibacillus sp. TaxID=2703680 RepID=UPI00260110EF|nr:nitronate monooxygenase [Metasolibacillus sp.]MCT6922664.1 nitronate monooxygenase [Metasolibacillus sp.]MCT6938997.1 nitronate monooxygenase [Metasolibacillus sp.]